MSDENKEACESFKENIVLLIGDVINHIKYFNECVKKDCNGMKKQYDSKIIKIGDMEQVLGVCKKEEPDYIIDLIYIESTYFWTMIKERKVEFLENYADKVFSFIPGEHVDAMNRILTYKNTKGEKVTSQDFVNTCFDYFDALVDDMKVRQDFISAGVKQKAEVKYNMYEAKIKQLDEMKK